MFNEADLKNIIGLIDLAFRVGEVKDQASAGALLSLSAKARAALQPKPAEPENK